MRLLTVVRALLCLGLCSCHDNTRMFGDRGSFYSSQDQQDAERAGAIFASFRPGVSNVGPTNTVYNPANRAVANNQKTALRAVVQSLRGKPSLTTVEHDQLVTALAPFTNYLNQATSQSHGGIVIPAGGAVHLLIHGYCLDRSFPAPGPGEQFRLVPISTILPPELLPIYQAVISHDLRRAEIPSDVEFAAAMTPKELIQLAQLTDYRRVPVTQQDTQGTLWVLRSVALNNLQYPVTSVNEAQMEYAYPGANQIIKNYIQTRNSSLSFVFNSPVDSSAAVAALTRAATQAPPSNLGYTEIQPGVVAHGYATGAGLSPTIDIVNTTPAPAEFTLANWVAQAPRQVQRVALPAYPTSVSYAGPSPSTMTPVQRAALLEVLGVLGDVAAQFTPAAPVIDTMLAAAALQQLNSWMLANQQSGEGTRSQPVTVTPTGNQPSSASPDPDDQNEPKKGDLNLLTDQQMKSLAQQDGYTNVEQWKTSEVGLDSGSNLYKDRFGNIYSMNRINPGQPQPTGLRLR